MAKSVFRIFSFDEFNAYLRNTTFNRKVTTIQNHHTFKPNYSHFNRQDPKYMTHLEGMRRVHIQERKWSDIGQNLTIFPDGKIALCRPIDIMPAGIFGANKGGICIESIGDFDSGKDVMSADQKGAILQTNAALCIKFGLEPVPQHVVYHHWYDTKGRRFSDTDINTKKVFQRSLQKTCPGTNFFCQPGTQGNTIECAVANFFPLIKQEMNRLQQASAPTITATVKRVKANSLNVRSGPAATFRVLRKLPHGLQIQVFDTQEKWSKINLTAEEWVSSDFLA